MGITEEELEEVVLAVQEDAAKARLPDTAARAVGVLTTEVRYLSYVQSRVQTTACDTEAVARGRVLSELSALNRSPRVNLLVCRGVWRSELALTCFCGGS